MSDWHARFAGFIYGAEGHFDLLKGRLLQRLDAGKPLLIVPYMGYGSPTELRISGRVLAHAGGTTHLDNEGLWDRLGDMYRRFETDEVPFPALRVRLGELEHEITGNEEGFFRATLQLGAPLPQEVRWAEVDVALLSPGDAEEEPVQAAAPVMISGDQAQFAVISDMDDTVLPSYATEPLRMARTLFLGDAATRIAFPGTATFYRALQAGANPLFYLSSSPWNLYDMLEDFLALQKFPRGPLLLRDWGITAAEFLPVDHKTHKGEAIAQIMAFYADLPFILIGDSGQQDPEIYYDILMQHRGRVQAIYIRRVNDDAQRETELQNIAALAQGADCPLVVASDTFDMARHAAELGLIEKDALERVLAEMIA